LQTGNRKTSSKQEKTPGKNNESEIMFKDDNFIKILFNIVSEIFNEVGDEIIVTIFFYQFPMLRHAFLQLKSSSWRI
jgi:hypothetical protein